MGKTTKATPEQIEEMKRQIITVDFIGSVALDDEIIGMTVDDHDGRHYIWGVSWQGAAYLAASLVIDAEKVLLRQGVEFQEAKRRVREHCIDASFRISEALRQMAQEEEE